MADGRSRKAAATKKAAAVRARASRDTGGKRAAQRIDEVRSKSYNPEVKMGIADPGLGKVGLTVRVGLKAFGKRARQTGYAIYKTSSPTVQKVFVGPPGSRILGARPTKVDPKPVAVRSSTPPKVTNAPPTTTFGGGPAAKVPSGSMPRLAKYAPRTNPSTSRTTSVLKDPTARWQAGQATRTAVGKPIARRAGTGRAAKAAATKKKK